MQAQAFGSFVASSLLGLSFWVRALALSAPSSEILPPCSWQNWILKVFAKVNFNFNPYLGKFLRPGLVLIRVQ